MVSHVAGVEALTTTPSSGSRRLAIACPATQPDDHAH